MTNKELRKRAYQTSRWRKLRMVKLREQPLCEMCLKKGKVKEATEVHHRKSFIVNGRIDYDRLFDLENLCSICRDCHIAEHVNVHQRYTDEYLKRKLQSERDEEKDKNKQINRIRQWQEKQTTPPQRRKTPKT